MILNNGMRVRKFVKDSYGPGLYVMWIEDCFDPTIYMVRGESFEDAFAWFICEEKIEAQLRITPEEMGDYDEDSLTYNDNGVAVDTEMVCGKILKWAATD